MQNSLYVQVLRSPILTALLHGTSAAGVGQTLRRRTTYAIMELSQRAPRIFGRATITLGIGIYSGSIFSYLLFFSPNRSRRRLDVYHTSTHDVALVQIYDAGLKRAARGSLKYRTQKNRQKSPSTPHRTLCRAISSQLRHISTIGKNC